MPIKAKTYLLAKATPHGTVAIVSSLVASVCIAIATSAPVYLYPFYILIPLMANVLFALAGIIINALFPKLEFANEVQVIKQSLASVLSLVFGMLIGGGFAVAALFATNIFGTLGLLGLMTGVLVIMNICAYLILVGPIADRVEKFSA